jgi:hypothetical protein
MKSVCLPGRKEVMNTGRKSIIEKIRQQSGFFANVISFRKTTFWPPRSLRHTHHTPPPLLLSLSFLSSPPVQVRPLIKPGWARQNSWTGLMLSRNGTAGRRRREGETFFENSRPSAWKMYGGRWLAASLTHGKNEKTGLESLDTQTPKKKDPPPLGRKQTGRGDRLRVARFWSWSLGHDSLKV